MSLWQKTSSRTPVKAALLVAIAAAVVVSFGAVALAQGGDGSAPGIDPETGNLPSIARMFYFSPYVNGVIAGLSVIALLLFLFFLLTINTATMVPTGFVDDVTKLVLNRKYEDAASLCRAHRRVFVASVVQRCCENAGKGHSVIMDMLDTEGRRRADIMWNRISYLADVANVAPMLGLLGTVWGMMEAFFTAEYQALNASAGMLTRGIGGAMTTTLFGLVVAILALVFYSLTKSRATRALAQAEQVVHSIADHIKRDETA